MGQMYGRQQSRLANYIGSAVENLSNSFFAMGQVSYVIAIGVVFVDLGCHASVEAFVLEGGDE